MLESQNPPLCMDGRMLALEGSGVATYAHALGAAQRRIDPDSLRLEDGTASLRRAASQGRSGRWLRALLPLGTDAAFAHDASGRRILLGSDLFRLAQVWFDVHRRLLTVRVPGPAGLMHWSYPLPLRLAGWHNVYTVHDVIPLTDPDLSPIPPGRHARLLRCIVREAATSGAIVTVSRAARDEIVATLHCSPELVTDCGQAVSSAEPAVALPNSLQPDSYLLVCGSIEPRKNIAAILAAYRASGVAIPLVLAGADGWRAQELHAMIAATHGVVRLPQVSAPTMAALLAGARALLMPSLAEGFGLPVAEAMALGTPVLTSREGALAETAGPAALLVDPRSEGDLAAGIRRIAGEASLRADLAAAGLVQARRFTPERFAERLSALYGTVLARSPAPSYRTRNIG